MESIRVINAVQRSMTYQQTTAEHRQMAFAGINETQEAINCERDLRTGHGSIVRVTNTQ
jgi:hypothetical protein